MTAQLLPPDASEFIEKFWSFRYSVFRLETLQAYRNSGEDELLNAFLAGRPRPPDPEDEDWLAMLAEHARAGRVQQRVHVVREPLSGYCCYELTWGYGPHAEAGEDIRIIPVPEGADWPADLSPEGADFVLFDSHQLFAQHYRTDGWWLGTEPVTDPARVMQASVWRDAALFHSVPWADYVRDHPELAAHVAPAALAS